MANESSVIVSRSAGFNPRPLLLLVGIAAAVAAGVAVMLWWQGPNWSLLYGNLDEAVKKKLAADAGNTLDLSFEARSVHLVNASTGVPVSEWHTLAEQPLARA